MLALRAAAVGRPRRLPAHDHRDPAPHRRDADDRLLRHPGRRGAGRRRAHAQGPDRPLPGRRPTRRRLHARGAASTRRRASSAIDRVELRRRNLIRRFPHRTPLGFEYDSGRLRALPRAGARAGGRLGTSAGGAPGTARRSPAPASRSTSSAPAASGRRGDRARARRRLRGRQQRLPARPGPRDDVRPDRRRPAGLRARSGRAALRRQRDGARAAWARSAAARWRWPARRSSSRSRS